LTRGLYAAGSRLINCSKAMDVTGNNLANSGTAGYKKDTLVSKTFGECLAYKISNNNSSQVGGVNHGVTADQVSTSYEQGVLQHTGRPMDLAIEGEGFFTIRTPEGETRLTRNGQFGLNAEGILTDAAGNIVLGSNGPLYVQQADFSVSGQGEIIANGVSCGTLLITCPADSTTLVKEEETQFLNNNGGNANDFQGSIKQGFLENANVDMTEEMSEMMVLARSYQSCGQVIKMMDRIMEKTVNEIARF